MTQDTIEDGAEWGAGRQRLAVLLAAAMFVLVVDTSLMNVSIAAVVDDLDTTVSGVQGAIALEALVSAAFILIGSKVADLIGRKRAFVLGLLGYAIGRDRDDVRPGPDRDHRVLGRHRRARRVAAAAVDAGADPRQLRGRRAEEGLRAGRRRGGDRRRRRAAARRLLDHRAVVARRVRAGGGRDRGRADQPAAHQGRALHGLAQGRLRRRRALRGRHGRRHHRHPRLAGGRRVRRRPDRDRARRARSRSPAGSCAASASGRPTLLDPGLFRRGPVPARSRARRCCRTSCSAG